MENLLNQHRDNSCIQMIYFPHELNREKALLKGRFIVVSSSVIDRKQKRSLTKYITHRS